MRSRINPEEQERLYLAGARAGDQDAFRALYQLHIRRVRAMARAMLHTRDVDDVCQEVFLRAFAHLSNFAGESSFRTWISRITAYECLRTRRTFHQVMNGGERLSPLPPAIAGPDARLDDWLDLERILSAMSPAQRQVLELTYLEEMEAGEIALLLGTTEGQVRSMLYRAKGRVRKNK